MILRCIRVEQKESTPPIAEFSISAAVGEERVMGGYVTVTLGSITEVAVGKDYDTNLVPIQG